MGWGKVRVAAIGGWRQGKGINRVLDDMKNIEITLAHSTYWKVDWFHREKLTSPSFSLSFNAMRLPARRNRPPNFFALILYQLEGKS